jgi:hypothetical protein
VSTIGRRAAEESTPPANWPSFQRRAWPPPAKAPGRAFRWGCVLGVLLNAAALAWLLKALIAYLRGSA